MAAARTPGGKTDPEFRRWLRDLRESAGLTQDELAAAVGTDRRNIRRWEVDGHDPGGTALLRVLSAVGVEILPPPRGEAVRAVNAELRELQELMREESDAAASRHDELMGRLDAQEEQLRVLSARPKEIGSPSG